MLASGQKEGFTGFTVPVAQKRDSQVAAWLRQLVAKLTCLDRINRVYAQAAAHQDQWRFLTALLEVLQVEYDVDPEDLARIPAQGPLLVVANHPFGGLEGIILPALLGRVRQDVRLLANYLLKPVVQLRQLFIYVDPFGTRESARANLRGLRQALAWLQQGGVLGVFPAGEVSHLHLSTRTVTDPVWSPTVARLQRQTQAAVLPVYFDGHNGMLFQALGMLHPLLRTTLLPREALNKTGKTIRVKLGQVIAPEVLAALKSATAVMDYLRLRTYMLQNYFTRPAPAHQFRGRPRLREYRPRKPVVAAEAPTHLAAEIQQLPATQLLIQSGPFQVYVAQAHQIPLVLQEIGRLRELTFRAVGEGTGRAIDLDRFDGHYDHLFLWQTEAQEVVGAYRLGRTDRILAEQGRTGLYTATLFHFGPAFLRAIQPALELGRSFVRLAYQKNYSPLLLLWKGIGRYLTRHPHYRFLFGPVSISNAYNEFSQGLLATWLSMHTFLPELAQHIKPKNPFYLHTDRTEQLRLALAGTQKVEDLAAILADVDPCRRGVPILLKHYLKLGGRLLGFNRDPQFNDALDGLILVDLHQTPAAVLQRYLGAAGYEVFARHQGLIAGERSVGPTHGSSHPEASGLAP